MMKSLRVRLFMMLLLTTIVFWISWLFFIGSQIGREETGWWDVSMREIASEILLSLPPEAERLAGAPVIAVPQNSALHQVDGLSYQIWVDGRNVMRSAAAPAAPLKADLADGSARSKIDGDIWWVYAVSDPRRKVQVQVGRRQKQLAHDLGSLMNFNLINTGLILIVLSASIWLVLRWSLAPLAAVREAMQKRQAFDLTPLPVKGLPSEVRPLVDSFNGLLEQLNQGMQGELRFIADAAHELRTPLAALSVQAHVALRADSIESKNAALLQLAVGVERSTRLSEQLLDLARLDAIGDAACHGPVNLAELVEVVLRDFDAIAREKRQLISLDAEPCVVLGDIDEIGILLRNLIDNALRYSGQGKRVAVSCRRKDAWVQFKIADNGPGVAVAERQAIFERFYRVVGSSQRGSGIGLSLVRRIAQSHAASIEVGDGLEGRGLAISVLFAEAAQE